MYRFRISENGTVPLTRNENEQDAYPLPVEHRDGQPLVADWAPLVRGVLADRAAGVPISRISARFHNALADMALEIAASARPRTADRAQRRMFPERPADRTRAVEVVAIRLPGVYS